jgi:hypothetical protein
VQTRRDGKTVGKVSGARREGPAGAGVTRRHSEKMAEVRVKKKGNIGGGGHGMFRETERMR